MPRCLHTLPAPPRDRCRVLAAGGTIAMRGDRAVPALDASELVEQLPQVAGFGSRPRPCSSLPSAHLTLARRSGLARRAAAAASSGEGVVLTTGTDTMEEVAMVCGLTYGGEAPIVITGANRPGQRPRCRRPGEPARRDHPGARAEPPPGSASSWRSAARSTPRRPSARSTAPARWRSARRPPGRSGGSSRAGCGSTRRRVAPTRCQCQRLEHRVATVTTGLGDDGALLRHAAEISDGVVLVALGAGHLSQVVLARASSRCRARAGLITCRPDRSSMLFSTYGFEGAERDLRASGAICAPFLSPAAARMALLCCTRRGARPRRHAAALAPFDAR